MDFFIIKNDEQHGPFTIDQLRTMDIFADTPVWHQGLDNWVQAIDVEELKDIVAVQTFTDEVLEAEAAMQDNRPKMPPLWVKSEQPQASKPEVQPAQPQGIDKPKKSHKKLWITLGIVGVLFLLLAMTNPSKDDHCREITNVSRSWFNENVVDNLPFNKLIGGATKMLSTNIIRSVVDDNVKVDNYILFSIGYVDTGAEKSKVSFGILGHVYTFNKDQINEKIMGFVYDFVDGVKDFFSFSNSGDPLTDGIMHIIGNNIIRDPGNAVIRDDENGLISSGDSTSSPQPIGESVIKEGIKMAVREASNYLIKKIDNFGR